MTPSQGSLSIHRMCGLVGMSRASYYRQWRQTAPREEEAAIALHYMHYNFARIHKTLRVTPAMEAGVADHVWSLEEIAGLAS